MKTDSGLQRDVLAELTWEPSVQAQHIGVSVKGGVVTLTEDVNWNYQREAAHDAVRHLMGVKAVTNLIKLNVPDVTTAEVRMKIDSALKRNMAKDATGITIEATSGKVKLRGKVHSWEEHDAAAIDK